MVENQGRGTLHIHMLLWINGAPNANLLYNLLDSNMTFKQNILEYIDKIIHTDIFPFSVDCLNKNNYKENKTYISINRNFNEFLLHHFNIAISSYQLHVHCFSCWKNSEFFICRYRKPDLISKITNWIKETGSFLIRKNNGMINNFNIFINAIIKSNHDVHMIQSGIEGLAIIHYICNYITKNSIGIETLLILQKAAIKQTIETPLTNIPNNVNYFNSNQLKSRDFFIRLLNQISKFSQVSSNEIATKLLQLPMSYKSHTFVTLNVYYLNESYQEYLSLDDSQKIINYTT